jgi:hypothetical protein
VKYKQEAMWVSAYWARWRTAVKIELSDGEEGLVGGSEPAVKVDEVDLMTTGNGVVRGLERS